MKSSILLFILAFLIGCNKETEKDAVLPVITISSPTNNQVFSAGQTVNINGLITDNKMLNEIHLEIININTGAFITHEHYSPAASTYSLSKSFTTAAATSYKIKVEAHDENNNAARTEVLISSN